MGACEIERFAMLNSRQRTRRTCTACGAWSVAAHGMGALAGSSRPSWRVPEASRCCLGLRHARAWGVGGGLTSSRQSVPFGSSLLYTKHWKAVLKPSPQGPSVAPAGTRARGGG